MTAPCLARITGEGRVRGRWEGILRARIGHADYNLWRRVAKTKEAWRGSFSDAELPAIRAEFERAVR